MSSSLEEQIKGLKRTIAEMETQRESLGDEFVDAALVPFQRKLDDLIAMLHAREAPLPAEPVQQRKLVTLLFMDIVGSTSIAQQMDPEDVSEIFDLALKQLAKPIIVHGGRVTRFMGDGLLSVFGTPTAREDDPEQAVRAGLKIIELANSLAPELQDKWDISTFQVRVGINTGLVMLGGQTEAEDTLMGAAVNLAARLESAAPPGGLLVSHDSYRHIRGVFDVESWQPIQVKGFDEPVQVYRILRARPRTFRTLTRGVEGMETRMIGRHDELKYLQDALLTAMEENFGQIITVVGEAGVGKSRLLYEFQNWIELQPSHVLFYEGRAYQEAQGLPYGLLRNLFEYRFQIRDDDSAESACQKIAAGLTEVFGDNPDGEMRVHILGQLLGFDFKASPHLKGVLGDAEQLRNRGLMYLGEYFRDLCAQDPLAVLLEDIHWADDSSLNALSWLGERLYEQRLLIVCVARPTLFERRPFWGEGLTFHHRINLEPLSRRESRQLVTEILKLAQQVPTELYELVVEGAEGNPFYVEELVKMLVEDSVIVKGEETWRIHPERLAQIVVPPTLAGVLQARLDSLPPEERAVLQQAAVVGRVFWDRVVAYIQAAEGDKTQATPGALTSLRGREMVYRREVSAFIDAREYLFKHDILREVTYESVLKRLRKRYHGLVADWLIAQVADRADEYSGLIAGHLFLAGRQEQAGGYYLQAGQTALIAYANSEAEGYFRQALKLSLSVAQEAACLAGLGKALSQQGSRKEAVQTLRQAIDLYMKMEDNDTAAFLYSELSLAHWHGDNQKAWDACQEGLSRLQGAQESPGMARLLAEAGRTALFQGKPRDEVVSLCQRAIDMAESQDQLEAKAEASITIALVTDEDLERSIQHLQEVITFTEANGLLRQAARAHTDIASMFGNLFLSNETAYQHDLMAANLLKRVGDLEGLSLALENVAEGLILMGRMRTVENILAEILRNSSAPQSWIDEFHGVQRSRLSYPRGEWSQALEFTRRKQRKLRETGSYQFIANNNLNLVDIYLELNRFSEMNDLSEAEAALENNIDINWHALLSNFLLVVISSRKKNFTEAHDRLAEATAKVPVPSNRFWDVQQYNAIGELAMAEGKWDEALYACQNLIDIYQDGGYRWKQARQHIDLGDIFLWRNSLGDREKARSAFQLSLQMFNEMDAPGYIRVLEERLAKL